MSMAFAPQRQRLRPPGEALGVELREAELARRRAVDSQVVDPVVMSMNHESLEEVSMERRANRVVEERFAAPLFVELPHVVKAAPRALGEEVLRIAERDLSCERSERRVRTSRWPSGV